MSKSVVTKPSELVCMNNMEGFGVLWVREAL